MTAIRPTLLALLALAAAATGCLSVPDGTKPECNADADCDRAGGEVCDEGLCWGNPPPGPFAAIVSPPSERLGDVVARELEVSAIPPDGYFDIQLDEPVLYTGQIIVACPPPVAACDTTPLGVSIVVTRPSFFAGGPGYRQVVSSDPRTGTFQLVLPRTQSGDPPYTVTVVPDGRLDTPSNVDTGELVPPLRTTLRVTEDQIGKSFQLGAVSLATIDGKIVDTGGNGRANYRVVALGRWDANSPSTEVSTVFYTKSDGTFSLRLSQGLVPGSVLEIVAKPYTTTRAPTLHMNVTESGSGGSSGTKILVAPDVGSEVVVSVVVDGASTNGGVTGVIGARVFVTGTVAAQSSGGTSATFAAEGTTGDTGLTQIKLLDGGQLATNYRISIVPPAGSTVGIVFDEPFAIGNTNHKRLPERVALAGRLGDIDGTPLHEVQVTARPSLRFLWSLDNDAQAFVAAIPAATTVTDDAGEFVVFIDPLLANEGIEDIWGSYDVSFDPIDLTTAPSWTAFDFGIPRDTSVSRVQLPGMTLPDIARIHGRVTDGFGGSVEGAEVRLFSFASGISPDLCNQVSNAPSNCPIPAQQLGRGTSDFDGIMRLTLPRP